MAERNIEFKVRAVDEASAVFKNVGHELELLRKGVGGEKGGFLEDLGSTFGRRSTFGEIAHLFEGRGPVRGLTIASKLIQEATKEAAELSEQFHAGSIGAADIAEKVAGGLPLIGQFWKAGRAIRELFSGDAQEVKRISEEAERTNAAYEVQKKILEDIESFRERSLKTIRQIRQETELIGKKGAEAELIRSGNTAESAVDAAEEAFKAQEKKLVEDAAKKVASDKDALREAQKRAAVEQEKFDQVSSDIKAEHGGVIPEHSASFENAQKARDHAQREVDRLQSEINHEQKLRDDGIKEAAALRQKTIAEVQERAEEQAGEALGKGAEEEQKVQEKMEKLESDHQQRLADLESQARVARLKALDQDADAELETLARTAAREIEAIDEKEKAKTLMESEAEAERQAIRTRAADDEERVRADAAEKQRKEGDKVVAEAVRDFKRMQHDRKRGAEDRARDASSIAHTALSALDDSGGSAAGARLKSQLEIEGGRGAQVEAQDKGNELLAALPKAITEPLALLLKDIRNALSGNGPRTATASVYSGE